jgi:hypothetical protein
VEWLRARRHTHSHTLFFVAQLCRLKHIRRQPAKQ